MWYLVSSKSYLQGIFYKGGYQNRLEFNFNYLNRYKYLFNARKTRSLIFVQSIALLFGMVIINLILFIILFNLAIILADSFNALRIGSIFTLSMWVIVLSDLIYYLIFRKFQEKFNLPTTVLTMVEYYYCNFSSINCNLDNDSFI